MESIENTEVAFASLQRLVGALSSKGHRVGTLGDYNSLQAFYEAYSEYVKVVTPEVVGRMLTEHNILWEALNKLVEVCNLDHKGSISVVRGIIEDALDHLEPVDFDEGDLVKISPYFKGGYGGCLMTITRKHEHCAEGIITFHDKSFTHLSVKNSYILPFRYEEE